MAKCIKIRRKKKQVCTGSLNRLITIQTRTLKPPTGDSVDYNEGFTNASKIISDEVHSVFPLKFPIILSGSTDVWAMVETVANETFFDDTSTERIVTHIFYINYISDIKITSENWIKYRGQFYDIVGVENLEYNNDRLRIFANVRGRDSLPVNRA